MALIDVHTIKPVAHNACFSAELLAF